MSRRMVKLSATAIAAFKSCPKRYYFRYVKGLTTAEDKATFRYGTAWHRVLEILSLEPGSVCPECAKHSKNPECRICGGTDTVRENLMDVASWVLSDMYAEKEGLDPERMELEQVQILYAATMYKHLYSGTELTVIDRERKFSLPLIGNGGRALPHVVVDGVIDKTVEMVDNRRLIMEHKTTSKSIDSGSDYWDHLALDTQISLYVWAACQLNPEFEIRGVYYDVFHKPGIKPSALTQKDSLDFSTSGEYCGQKFEVEVSENGEVKVNGTLAQVTPGKKEGTFAIRETAEMYGARLMQDIAERPEFYFARREIARTDADIDQFDRQLRNIYVAIRNMERDESWFCNESQCQATFKCEFCPLCFNNIRVGDEIPEGYVSLFKKENSDGTTHTSTT